MPERIQRRRTKGWRMPVGAVYVGRPSLWGNPYSLDDLRAIFPEVPIAKRPAVAVRLYRDELKHWGLMSDYAYHVSDETWDRLDGLLRVAGFQSMGEATAILRGHDLVCWCPLDQPCHADVLLELANR